MIIYFIIFVIIAWIWMVYEFHRAPYSDGDDNITKKKKNGNK